VTRSRRLFAQVLALTTTSGCALLASANAEHSGISPCVSDTGFAVTDLVLAAAATGILVGTGQVDDSPAWMAVPGVFVVSGVLGAIFAHRCARSQEPQAASTRPMPVYEPIKVAPPLSQLPTATPADLGLPPPDPTLPPVRLQLGPDYVLNEPAPASQLDCGATPPAACPDGTTCQLDEKQHGTCVPAPVPSAPAP
jgi:hypothetical protein